MRIQSITTNGISVVQSNGRITINGKDVTDFAKETGCIIVENNNPNELIIEGNLTNCTVDCANLTVHGDITGNLDATNVRARTIKGKIDATNVSAKIITGDIK